MRQLLIPLTAAILVGGCSSAAAPGADDVLNQVDKAKQVQEDADRHNAELEDASTP